MAIVLAFRDTATNETHPFAVAYARWLSEVHVAAVRIVSQMCLCICHLPVICGAYY